MSYGYTMLKNAHQGAGTMMKIQMNPTERQVKAAIKRGNSAYIRIDTLDSEYWELVKEFIPAKPASRVLGFWCEATDAMVETYDGNLYGLDRVEIHS
jgi:hypothetical protein